MKLLRNKKYNPHLYFFTALFLFFIAFFAGKYFLTDLDEKSASDQIQDRLLEKDSELRANLDQLIGAHQNNSDTAFILYDQFDHSFSASGYVFLITQNDSLVFWNSNKVPFDSIIENSEQQVINTGNGWYRLIPRSFGRYNYFGLYLIKNTYNYQNDYLRNAFHPSFGLPCQANLSTDSSKGHQIYDTGGNYLFSLEFRPSKELSNLQAFILFFIYLTVLLLFIRFMYEIYLKIFLRSHNRLLFVGGFIIDLIIIRAILFYFRIPQILSDTPFFSPHYYAYSDFIPSIGDLFLHVLFILIIAFFFFSQIKFHTKYSNRHPARKIFVVFTLFFHVFIFSKGLSFIYESLILDSSIALDLNNVFSFSWMSLFSFLILAMSIMAYVLVTARLCFFSWSYYKNYLFYFLLSALAFLVFLSFCIFSGDCDYVFLSFVFIYILITGTFFHFKSSQFNLPNIVSLFLLFAAISTYALHKYNHTKEQEHRKLLAVHLATEQRDPLAEFKYLSVAREIYSDQYIKKLLLEYNTQNFNQDNLEGYLFSNYFSGYLRKYDYQLTICDRRDVLMIQPEDVPTNCFAFFNGLIRNIGVETSADSLYFLDYGHSENGYISVLTFYPYSNKNIPVKLFIEITPKYFTRNLGFPDLLIDESVRETPDLSHYSYAKYFKGKLYKRVGKYFYHSHLSEYIFSSQPYGFFDQNGYSHLYYKIDNETDLIVSKKHKTILDLIAPFSYLFISFSVFTALVFFIFVFPFSNQKIKINFRTRLQLYMSAIILISFIVIGIFTLYYINDLNDQKNRDILSEKTHSLLVEMQHKFADFDYFDKTMSDFISELLVKFYNVFFTDINLFNLNGDLIATSRPQIFEEDLISRKMNPEAFYQLDIENSSLFIHEENIGEQHYLSAYIPFVNNRNELIAYLNLPYFAKENDLKREISSFLVAYINIYVILIAFSILLALVVSNYISRPIKLIMQKIRHVKLGGQNEKIDWKREDEIGQLVLEYNRMIDELARSADLLARSERESAWREMAKQVAHEIKNPLTPMKLSVQYLERAWESKSPDWENRLRKFTRTMIDQIETLSSIASEFSDFAKMPLGKKEKVDLFEIIQNSISLFKNYDNISISFDYPEDDHIYVFADKEQLLRAFNNLLKNSVQAIGEKPGGKIHIHLRRSANQALIKLYDNGGGISTDLSDKIFSPSFTTKSGGMGLGLAIVKNVINLSGGNISFTSIEGKGTEFNISLPLLSYQD